MANHKVKVNIPEKTHMEVTVEVRDMLLEIKHRTGYASMSKVVEILAKTYGSKI